MHRTIGNRTFDFEREVAVMAVVNRTPDSFYDRGATFGLESALTASLHAVDAGADWVDIGGVPFGTGPEVSTGEEIDRVVPLVEAIAARSPVVISVDTFNAHVARHAIDAGASVVNDTSGFYDPDMASVVAGSDATIVLTHSLWPPRAEPPSPRYDDVVAEVIEFLEQRLALAHAAGIPDERIILDPGFDLNKNTYHSLELTRRLREVVAMGYPTLAAISQKDFIGEALDRDIDQRLTGTLATAVYCMMQGARILRMHNVREAVDAVRMVEAIEGWREPAYVRHNMGLPAATRTVPAGK